MDADPQSKNGPESPLMAQAVGRPASSPPRRSRSAGRLLAVLLFLALCGSLAMNLLLASVVGLTSLEGDRDVQEEYHSLNRGARNKVAIISVSGIIAESDGFAKRQIDRAMDDEAVKAVVLRVDSPGGTITGSDYIYHHLHELADKRKIPIVVSMGGLAASGGYYISMAVGDTPDAIFAEPTTWTGSIGVIIPHYDISGLLEEWNVSDDSIVSHPLKHMGSMTRPMTEEETAILQALVDDGMARFTEVVLSGRPEFRADPETLKSLATGQVYTARQAQANGLVDKIGFIEEAIDRAIELAQLDKKDVRVVEYTRTPTLADVLLGGAVRGPQFDKETLLEMTVPRAYYLYSGMPALAASRQ